MIDIYVEILIDILSTTDKIDDSILTIITDQIITLNSYDLIKIVERLPYDNITHKKLVNKLDVITLGELLQILNNYSSEYQKIKWVKLVSQKIRSLLFEDFMELLKIFVTNKHKYLIVKLFLHKTIFSYKRRDEILNNFMSSQDIKKINNFIDYSKKNIDYKYVLKLIIDYPTNDDMKLELLDKSVTQSGVNFDNSGNICDMLLKLKDENYHKACEILAINPELSESVLSNSYNFSSLPDENPQDILTTSSSTSLHLGRG